MRVESTLDELEGVMIQLDENSAELAEKPLDVAELSDGTQVVLSDWKILLPDWDMVLRGAILCETEAEYDVMMPQKKLIVIQMDDGKIRECAGSIFDVIYEIAEKRSEELSGEEPCVLVR